jgi:hypothetical protein
VRFDRRHFGRVIVFYKGDRMGEAKPVDLIANDRAPRRQHASLKTHHTDSQSRDQTGSYDDPTDHNLPDDDDEDSR